MRYNNLNEFKKHTIDYLKSIVVNKHNNHLIEVIKESGYLAAEPKGEIRIYLDKEKSYNNSIYLNRVEIIVIRKYEKKNLFWTVMFGGTVV